MSACLARDAAGCARCGGDGFVTNAGVELAEASLCEHLRACPSCKGKGYREVRDEHGYSVVRPCELRDIERRIALFNQAALPARYHAATFKSYLPAPTEGCNQTQVKAAFERWHRWAANNVLPGGHLPRHQKGIGLWGGTGVGKTHLMTALVRSLTLEHGIQVKFADFSSLLWDLKSGFDSGAGEGQLIAPLVDVEVLCIDELGKGRASEWEVGVLDAIVGGRYNRGRVTFFATNHPFSDAHAALPRTSNEAHAAMARATLDPAGQSLESRVGGRIFSRLAEMCEILPLHGPDARTRPAVAPTRPEPRVRRPG